MENSIANRIATALNAHHLCIFIYGSRAREDSRVDSDLDLAIICTQVTTDALQSISAACQLNNESIEVNPWVISEHEVRTFPIEMGVIKLQVEGKILTGDFTLPAISTADIARTSSALLTEAMMSIRHYQVSGELDALPEQKRIRYILKPFMHGLRYHHYWMDGICWNNAQLGQAYACIAERKFQQVSDVCLEIMAANKHEQAL